MEKPLHLLITSVHFFSSWRLTMINIYHGVGLFRKCGFAKLQSWRKLPFGDGQ